MVHMLSYTTSKSVFMILFNTVNHKTPETSVDFSELTSSYYKLKKPIIGLLVTVSTGQMHLASRNG